MNEIDKEGIYIKKVQNSIRSIREQKNDQTVTSA